MPHGFGRRMGRFIFFIATVGSTDLAYAQSSESDPCKLYPRNPDERKAWVNELITKFGYTEFYEPPVVRPTSEGAPYELIVQYSKKQKIAGCAVELRSYNGGLVGSTIRAKPGDTLYIRVTNKLPAYVMHDHPQGSPPADHGHFSFNITNLHTHGLHTSPEGDSDNVFLEIHPEKFPDDPKGSQLYRIHIHDKHPTGTFWYHAHIHGSTGVQVSSGMAGAIIIEGGLDANGGLDSVPEIQAAEQKVFLLQQIRFGPDGKLEAFDQAIPTRKWSRNITVNGVFVPTVRLRPGEVQWWRIVHAGIEDNIHLSLDGHQLHEIATDGLAFGRRVVWPAVEPSDEGIRSLLLGPGYRTDVLVKAAPLATGETSKEYFLRDEKLPAALSLQAIHSTNFISRSKILLSPADLLAETGEKPQQIIARILIEGPPKEMSLPSSESLRDRVPSDLTPIKDEELTGASQPVRFDGASMRVCTDDGDCKTTCETESEGCRLRYTVNERVFMPQHPPRMLKLGQASEWTVMGEGQFPHPFHIHVNPFEVERQEPGPDGKMVRRKVWKDTINVPRGTSKPIILRSRYAKFTGIFVMHCHILGHEDMGMMERVEISK